jgi:hypothetical protein
LRTLENIDAAVRDHARGCDKLPRKRTLMSLQMWPPSCASSTTSFQTTSRPDTAPRSAASGAWLLDCESRVGSGTEPQEHD